MKKTTILILAFILMVGAAGAQATTKADTRAKIFASLEYFDNRDELVITDIKGFKEQAIYFGFVLDAGHTITTGSTSAEIKLSPNGSILKVAPNTSLAISSLEGLNGSTSNDIQLARGKVRMVASRLGSPSYQIKTPTSVAGVRGTDFGVSVEPGKSERLVVRDGTVSFQKAQGAELSVGAGQSADAFASTFATIPLSLQDLAVFFEDLDFTVLNPLDVPSETPAVAAAEKPATAAGTAAAVTSAPADGTEEAGADASAEDGWSKALREFLGLEIGSVTIDGVTYGKAVLQPRIKLDGFKLGLYLPVIYQEDLLDPWSWYRPAGNNEWSFGTDQGGNALDIAVDAARDLFLKLRYMEIGEQGKGFFLKVGNLSSMTLGHGIIIDSYANDADFPSIRKLGLNVGIDMNSSNIEVLANDLLDPEILGFRYTMRPAPEVTKAGVSFFVVSDIGPISTIDANAGVSALTRLVATDPLINFGGFDLEVPVLDMDILSLMAYGDIAVLLPYLRTATTGLEAGPYLQSAIDPLALVLRNFGWKTGVSGNISLVDYRLEFQYTRGIFEMGYVDQGYDRSRAQKAGRIVDSLVNVNTNGIYNLINMGIYGRAGFDIADIIEVKAGYRWPWTVGGENVMGNPDSFHLGVNTLKDMLPYGVMVDVSYGRTHFRELFARGSAYAIFDEYAVLRGGASLPIGDFFKLKVSIGTSPKRDTEGNILLDANGKPQLTPVFNIETVIGE